MAKPTAQQCHAMTTYFVNEYSEVVGRSPVVNRNKARWGFEAVLMDYSAAKTKELIDFYLTSETNPTLDGFLYNYDKVVVNIQDRVERDKSRESRREATQERLERWRNRWEK